MCVDRVFILERERERGGGGGERVGEKNTKIIMERNEGKRESKRGVYIHWTQLQ